jgi:hypothetical protein
VETECGFSTWPRDGLRGERSEEGVRVVSVCLPRCPPHGVSISPHAQVRAAVCRRRRCRRRRRPACRSTHQRRTAGLLLRGGGTGAVAAAAAGACGPRESGVRPTPPSVQLHMPPFTVRENTACRCRGEREV